jgi:N-hydroxyarylamine O-acetyltransferase
MGRSDAMWVVSCSAGWVGSHLDLSGVGTSVTASSFDQQAWFDRIGYNGSREPTLGTLHQLIFAHSNAIAYESLDIMLGRPSNLDLVSLQRKMIFGGPAATA